MLGFSKDEIVSRANEWMDKNQVWADKVTNDAVKKAGSDPFNRMAEGVLANLRVVLPEAIASVISEQNALMEKQIRQMIDEAVAKK